MNGAAFKDLVERTVSAWAFSFLGLILASGLDYTNLSTIRSAAVASIPAAMQVIYSAVASRVGDSDSAGFTRSASNGKH